MTTNITNLDIAFEAKNEKTTFSANMISSVAKASAKEEEFSADYKKILSLTAMSINMFANSYYKSCRFLESTDIEQIKASLNNYTNKSDKITEFKNAIIEDLTSFQKQIKNNHFQKLADLTKENQLCEKQIKVLNFAKNKLVMDRLSKVEWPYDEKTKAFDNKITTLQIKNQKCAQKIEELKQMKPLANEKDILIYQMQLKEKYSK